MICASHSSTLTCIVERKFNAPPVPPVPVAAPSGEVTFVVCEAEDSDELFELFPSQMMTAGKNLAS